MQREERSQLKNKSYRNHIVYKTGYTKKLFSFTSLLWYSPSCIHAYPYTCLVYRKQLNRVQLCLFTKPKRRLVGCKTSRKKVQNNMGLQWAIMMIYLGQVNSTGYKRHSSGFNTQQQCTLLLPMPLALTIFFLFVFSPLSCMEHHAISNTIFSYYVSSLSLLCFGIHCWTLTSILPQLLTEI